MDAGVVPLTVKALLCATQVEVLRYHAGVDVDRRVFIKARDVEGPVVHNVIKVDPYTEAMGGFDQIQQFRLSAIASAHRIALILASEIKRIPEIVANGKATTAFGGWR